MPLTARLQPVDAIAAPVRRSGTAHTSQRGELETDPPSRCRLMSLILTPFCDVPNSQLMRPEARRTGLHRSPADYLRR